MSVFDRVKELCDLEEISVSQMEKEIGISQGAAYKWKVSSPSQKMFEKLSAFFNVSVDYLITGEEPDKKEKTKIPDYDKDTMEMISLFSKLNKEQKNSILSMMRSFALTN